MDPHSSTGGHAAPTLPERLYLLSYDLDRDRLDPYSGLYRHALLRGAALAELSLRGLLADQDGKAARRGGDGEPEDPLLARVLAEVPWDRPRRWTGLVMREPGAAERIVRERLAEAGVITVRTRRLLGVVPLRTVTPLRPDEIRPLRERVRAAVLGGDPAAAPVEDAVLASLAVEGDVGSVFTGRERRANRHAIAALHAHVDAAVPGVRAAVRVVVTNARSGG
ncbi:GPP34 family phosphoprotein [Streptomonospora nanhaiensis]|uniref:GOLPH3/VPS74 family protein n=1 Tax=Streptomonospora nanhaiensis TaxID=1323731 RepID=UPI001C999146|nr:GPP34 family phosphoprotein [Streptomonospora nanhaiensis]MBX9387952.1 GPP34 family phosphoprotein [Streptomonospora nanhaiensis]